MAYGLNSMILPYFGETSDDNWILTYPMCQLAVSNKVEEDEAKKEAVMEVLLAIFSEEGQKAVAAGTTVLSYNKEVNISSSPSLQYAQQYIDSNHLYMRLASSMMNTLRAAYDDQIAVGYTPVASTSIYAGTYTLQQAKWVLTARNAIYRGEYTGEEIRRIMEWLVNVKEDGSNPIRHRNLMPVTSGMEYTVTETERGKFVLKDITIDGKPLDETATYTMLLVGADTFMEHETFCNCPMPEDLKSKREAYLVNDFSSQECMQEALSKTKQFLEPTEYVTIVPGE